MANVVLPSAESRTRANAWLAVLLSATVWLVPATVVSAQNGADLLYPADLDIFSVIDAGPVPAAPACACVPEPFALSPYRVYNPDHSGAGAPLTPPKPTEAEVRRLRTRWLEQRRELPRDADEGLDGNHYASFSVGMAFATGMGAERDDTKAAQWYALAAGQGNSETPALLASRYARGIGVQQDEGLAAQWYQLGAERGDHVAMVALGLRYVAGRGVPVDYRTAIRWWARASEGGDMLAMRLLGDAYACGIGVTLNYERAVDLYKRAEYFSRMQLGRMYRNGCGVPHDDQEAARLFLRDFDAGRPEAQIELSEMYRLGAGVEPNPMEAYQAAALAAHRLPPGELRDRAVAERDLAAGLISPQDREIVENTVKSLIDAALEP